MILKYEFSVATKYVGSMVKDIVEVDVEDDATDEEIEEILEEMWVEWRNNECEGGWKRA